MCVRWYCLVNIKTCSQFILSISTMVFCVYLLSRKWKATCALCMLSIRIEIPPPTLLAQSKKIMFRGVLLTKQFRSRAKNSKSLTSEISCHGTFNKAYASMDTMGLCDNFQCMEPCIKCLDQDDNEDSFILQPMRPIFSYFMQKMRHLQALRFHLFRLM